MLSWRSQHTPALGYFLFLTNNSPMTSRFFNDIPVCLQRFFFGSHAVICLMVIFMAFAAPILLHAQEEALPHTLSLSSAPTQDILNINLGSFDIPELKMIDGDNPRVYFELSPAYSWNEATAYKGRGRFVRQMRTCLYPERQSVRVVIDLSPNFDYQVDQYHSPENNRFTIVFKGTAGTQP